MSRKGGIGLLIVAVLFVAGLMIIGPKIAEKLEVIGIADDYLYYDDFSKGYFDDLLWSYSGKAPVMKDSMLIHNGHASGFTDITATDLTPGMHIKTSLQATTPYCQAFRCSTSGDGYSYAELYINDVLAYHCGKTDKRSTTYKCLVEAIPSFDNLNHYQIIVDGKDYKTLDVSNPSGDGKIKIRLGTKSYADKAIKVTGFSPASVDFVKYKVPYNCKINDDEILIFDSFSAGSTVNISALSHEPVKFCLDYPIKARSFDKNGIKTDIRGEILQKIVRGKSSVVPANEEWKVYYITKYEPGFSLRCDVDEAYNTNTDKCEDIQEKALVGCNTASDCYLPSGCIGVTVNCLENKCVYEGNCIIPENDELSLWDRFVAWLSGLFT